jgi:hypothetical protein
MIVICHVLLPQTAHAQSGPEPVRVEWVVDGAPEDGWTVGDRIPLRLRATYSAGMEVTLPELPQAWGPFEVREQALLEPAASEDGTVTAVREASVTLWAPGDYQTPALAVRYRETDGQLREVPVPPLTISVVSVLDEGETEKHDLKPQISLPRPPLWPWLLGGLLLAALLGAAGWLLLARLRRRTAPASALTVPLDTRPPEEIAYGELDRIAALDLPAQGEMKRHYTLVTDCMRTYVQERYHIPALDRTTEELVSAFRRVRIDRGHTSLLRELLTNADLVKFAQTRPPINQARAVVDQARHIVDVTKIENSEMREPGAHTPQNSNPQSRIPNPESRAP